MSARTGGNGASAETGGTGLSAGAGGIGLSAGTGGASAGDPPPPGAPAPLACLEPPPPGMACVPAGWFVRGTDTGPEQARPQARVWLQTYYLDVHEVTYAEYKACVKAKQCDPKGGPAYSDFDRPKQPINGVSWFHADGYCKAQGKRLPSEAQWEKGARGPDGALHPWGDEPATCERAILKDETGRGCGVKKQGSKPDTGRPWEIGSRPPGRYGLYDMSGNSWEWVADWFTRSYAECGAECEGVDPLGPCAKDGEVARECPGKLRKIVRGGSWYWDASYATGVWRRPHFPSNQPFHHFGFRCAARADEAAALQRAAKP
ncbi:formylglycine-generating enzyme family protein [Nannocystis bainbridge]|nr:SUMF1/EgtB/PvdO family nonheme iron enzyme [Nannocystis bainbridge]